MLRIIANTRLGMTVIVINASIASPFCHSKDLSIASFCHSDDGSERDGRKWLLASGQLRACEAGSGF